MSQSTRIEITVYLTGWCESLTFNCAHGWPDHAHSLSQRISTNRNVQRYYTSRIYHNSLLELASRSFLLLLIHDYDSHFRDHRIVKLYLYSEVLESSKIRVHVFAEQPTSFWVWTLQNFHLLAFLLNLLNFHNNPFLRRGLTSNLSRHRSLLDQLAYNSMLYNCYITDIASSTFILYRSTCRNLLAMLRV